MFWLGCIEVRMHTRDQISLNWFICNENTQLCCIAYINISESIPWQLHWWNHQWSPGDIPLKYPLNRFFISWPWPLTSLSNKLDLDNLPFDLHAKFMSVCLSVRVVTDRQRDRQTDTMSKLLHPSHHRPVIYVFLGSLDHGVYVFLLTRLNVAWSWTVLPDMIQPDRTHHQVMEGKSRDKAVMTVLNKPVKINVMYSIWGTYSDKCLRVRAFSARYDSAIENTSPSDGRQVSKYNCEDWVR